jgi:asparagine synthase (glutamine-hydrolysing)
MCGIAGILNRRRRLDAQELEHHAARMAQTVAHRGPDSQGVWVDADAGIAFGHQRLAIVDLSDRGHQPMHSADGRYTLTYNGELYNAGELRNEIARSGTAFRGHSDTEVLVEAIACWGFDSALARIDGMFAFAVWDRSTRALHLTRDRLGEKPLYYADGDVFLFGSELKALHAFPGFDPEIDLGALTAYLRLGFVPAPHSIYRGVHKLLPGQTVTVRRDDAPRSRTYWSLQDVVAVALDNPFTGTEDEAIDTLADLLQESVRRRLVADVPIGMFLSGGVDSTAIVAAMPPGASALAKTFTVAFDSTPHDESVEASRVAAHVGATHTVLQARPSRALELATQLPSVYDEPFADPSALPTAMMCEEARAHVQVALAGDGGDEIFGGYNRHTLGPALMRRMQRVPRAVRSAVAAAILATPHRTMSRAGEIAAGRLGGRVPRLPADKAQKLALLLSAVDEYDLRQGLVSNWPDPVALVPGVTVEWQTALTSRGWGDSLGSMAERMMVADTAIALPDGMLTKVDRASMRVGLEVRLPLLDPQILEFAWRLPLASRIRGRTGKWILRRVVDRAVPGHLVDRPKIGFDPPLGDWLRGPLRDWAESLLRSVEAGGLLDPLPIRRRWQEHISAKRNWDYAIWTVLVLQCWLDEHSG